MANEQYTASYKIISEFDPKGTQLSKKELQEVQKVAHSTFQATQRQIKAAEFAQKTLALSANSAAEAVGKQAGKFKSTMAAGAELAGVLGQGSGGLGFAMRGLGAIVGSFANGPAGVATMAITVLGGAITLFVKSISGAKQKMKELHEEYQKSKDAFEKGIDKSLIERVDNLGKAYGRLAGQIKIAGDYAKVIRGVIAVLSGQENRKELRDIDAETQRTVDSANTPQEKAIAQAQGKIKRTQAEGRINVDAAKVGVAEAEADLASTRKMMQTKKQYVEKLEDEIQTLEALGKDKAAEAAEKKLQDAKADLASATLAVKPAEIALQAATNNLAEAREIAATNNKEAKQKETDLILALSLEKEARETAAADLSNFQSQEINLKNALKTAIANETNARNKAAKEANIGNRKEGTRDRIADQGASEFINDRLSKREAAKEQQKQNEKDQKKADNLHRKKNAGTHLSDRDREWLNLHDEYEQQKKKGNAGGKNRDEAKKQLGIAEAEAQKQQPILGKLDEVKTAISNLQTELEKLNTLK